MSANVLHSSESNEWHTPDDVVSIARMGMGGIDLDPASCLEANERIRAAKIYTIADNGLRQPWHGRVFCNPPYGHDESYESNQSVWTSKALREYACGRTTQAVLLVNAVPDRSWFHPLWRCVVVFGYRRVKFVPLGGAKKRSPTHGNALIYLGSDPEPFIRAARLWGHVVRPSPMAVQVALRQPVRRTPVPWQA